MAPPKGKKGALEEQIKDVLVMTHFIVKGNSPAYAEQIRRSWDRHEEGNIVTKLPRNVGPREKSISLAGTIQVCERLASPERGILQKYRTVFGEKRSVLTYALSQTPDGFRKVARTMIDVSPFLFLSSHYAHHCLDEVWIPEIMSRLGAEYPHDKKFGWALKHSPTALMITLEDDFGAKRETNNSRRGVAYDELVGWAGACVIADSMSSHRSIRFAGLGDVIDFSVRARILGRRGYSIEGGGSIRLRRDRREERHMVDRVHRRRDDEPQSSTTDRIQAAQSKLYTTDS
jgi:hypothetical protein